MANGKWKGIAITVLSILLALAFLMAGGSKLAGSEQMVQGFEHWGYPSWFLYVTGAVEVLSAILLLIPSTRFYGAALLVCTMVGAVLTHLKAGETAMLGAPLVLGILAAVVTWSRRPR